MAGSASAPAPWPGSAWFKGLLVGGWLVGCDAWLKVTARVAACSDTPDVGTAIDSVYQVPRGCTEADFWGFAHLSPVVREGGPLGLGGGFTGGVGLGWGVALLAVAAIVSVLVLRWRWRSVGDASALGALWGAAITLGVPRIMGDGTGLAELHLGGLALGLGDLALVWVTLWLAWRLVAEARA